MVSFAAQVVTVDQFPDVLSFLELVVKIQEFLVEPKDLLKSCLHEYLFSNHSHIVRSNNIYVALKYSKILDWGDPEVQLLQTL